MTFGLTENISLHSFCVYASTPLRNSAHFLRFGWLRGHTLFQVYRRRSRIAV
jgi:hypothetical protein